MENYRVEFPNVMADRELLQSVARCALRTKLNIDTADKMADNVVSAMQCIAEEGKPIDLRMVEIMDMQHKSGNESTFHQRTGA